MNNEAKNPDKLESLRMRESSQAHSLSKHVEKLERILDAIAPKRPHQGAKATVTRRHEKLPSMPSVKNA